MHTLTQDDDYADLPHLMELLSPRDTRRFRRGILSAGPTTILPDPIVVNCNFVAPPIDAATAREVLGELVLPTPAIDLHTSWIFTLQTATVGQTAEFSFRSTQTYIDINLAKPIRYWDWASTFPAEMHRPWGRNDLGSLQVEVQAFASDSERSHFMLCQEKYHTTMLLNLFQGKLKEIPSLLTVAEAQLATNVRFAENHVLAHRNNHGMHDMYTLQERLQGNVPMLEFLNTFTHYTYWRTNKAAVINGLQYVGWTLFHSLIVDKKYDWHAGYFSGRISDFESDHRCNSLCRRVGMKQPAGS
ncbi:uncharacterized protein MELLADRAFT_89200 [Melampsora larici-populina 98AG31]|uniref:Alpha-type protein kinase domain-containing protein n=1 Tax=Melampsora larici-populina (strain 98AG31 / pathotype 3-4-7) TaxID=747676 RepID=F4R5B1_MELLP|nr:uncharacterized protein MELLADRAFT_89200 [Melampsora larici-populina 98AG31]EGG12017.1 hypothetical protein MELLADRAFT_89200 [Melampsora larici-populina 98AG31]